MTNENIQCWFVYILECSDKKKSLYTGFAKDLLKRIECHNKSKGAKYTRSRLPVKIVYFETYFDMGTAMSREYQIKQLSRKEKLELISKIPGDKLELNYENFNI